MVLAARPTTPLRGDERRGPLAPRDREIGIVEAAADERREFAAGVHHFRRIGLEEELRFSAEVAGVRAEGHRGPVGGRLDHVLAAPLAIKAASHEGDRRAAPPPAEFAGRVDQQHAGSRVGPVGLEPAAELPRHPAGLEQRHDLRRPLNMPRHDHQPQPRVRRGQFLKGCDGQLLFRCLRAAGEEHERVVGDAGQLAEPEHGRIGPVARHTIELHRAGHDDRRRPEGGKAVGVGVRAGDHEARAAEHPAGQRPESTVAAEAALAHPCIDDDDRNPAGLRDGQQVGPEFEFSEHEQGGANAIERPPDGP